MKRKPIFIILIAFSAMLAHGVTRSAQECQGSLRPYPTNIRYVAYPDSLQPFFINHIGRHGSRFPAGSYTAMEMQRALTIADSLGTITPLGKRFLTKVNSIIALSKGRWGELDSLGMAEQRGIARRMATNYPMLVDGVIRAISTPKPRVVMSMYQFAHQLTEMNSKVKITASEGENFDRELRFFNTNTPYFNFIAKKGWQEEYSKYLSTACPLAPIKRLLGEKFPATDIQWREMALNEYYLIAGAEAMGMEIDYREYLTLNDYSALWSIFNLRQYLQHAASTVSTLPADAAQPLVEDLINVADSVIDGKLAIKAQLRFAHAETLIPLLSLIKLKGCYYLTHYFDTVSDNWQDYNISPMAANLQLVYFKAPSGTIYVRADLNERPVPAIPGHQEIYLPWQRVKEFMLSTISSQF